MESDKPNEYLGRGNNRNRLEFLEQNFVSSRRNVDEGRWWTLITSTFTHFSLPHLGVNMYTLWSFGRPIVLFYGVPTYVLLWLGAGVGGNAFQIYWSDIVKQAVNRKIIKKPFGIQEDRGGVGASASILGMIGVISCAFPSNSLFALGFVTGSILCIQYGWLPWIGHKSHLGGMATGATWWLLFLRRRRGW
jgi:membrane associated rhomboid family serine protease